MNRKLCGCLATLCLLLANGMPVHTARAEDTPFIGEMIWVPFNFEPKGWAFCDGRLLPISQNTALFSLLGTQYGGDGKSTFALPDMRGKLMIHAGQGPSSTEYVQGETGGETAHALLQSEMPAHNHVLRVSTAAGSATNPASNYYAQSDPLKLYSTSATSVSAVALSGAGSGQPHNNMMPYGTLTCIIALQGIYPSRP